MSAIGMNFDRETVEQAINDENVMLLTLIARAYLDLRTRFTVLTSEDQSVVKSGIRK